jgi:hypothetical protein
MIDMGPTKRVLQEALDMIEKLQGQDLDEQRAVEDQSTGERRRQRARLSQNLQFVATRLELAAALVRVEYWHARGKTDPLRPERALNQEEEA